jgi:hypothetical protein
MTTKFTALLSAVVFAGMFASVAQTTPATFSIRIVARQDVVKTGSSIGVVALLTDTTNHKINFIMVNDDMGGDNGYIPKVLDDTGNPLPLSKYGQLIIKGPRLQGRSGQIRLQPGDSTVPHEIILSELYDLTRPGKYTIQMERIDKDSKVHVKSNIITVTVTP